MASLYLHIPFCEHKCLYCDFYSIESLEPLEDFLKALGREIDRYASFGHEESFETIYFGGGTPSLLSPEAIGDIIGRLRTNFRIDKDAEVTLEANPGTVDRAKLLEFRNVGINRLSFGIQSFDDAELKFLTRIHSSSQARDAVRLAREAGFDNISIDLIFALPKQTLDGWRKNLEEGIALQPQHISAYSLIVEQGTPLARLVRSKQVSPLPVEAEAEMYELTMATLRDAGYEHYEVSNYALPGFRSRHNSNYWNHSNYLGFGPSAHSFWSGKRWWNFSNLGTYCGRIESGESPVAGTEELTDGQMVDEAVMLGLRSEGVDLERLAREHGIDLIAASRSVVESMIADRLAVRERNLLRLTDKGYLICDGLSESLLARIPAL